MVPGHVRDLVGQDRGQLRLALCREQQTGVHPDKSARHREGIDGVVLDHEELEVQARVGIHCGQAVPQRTDVVRQLRVVQIARFLNRMSRIAASPDAALHLGRQDGSRHIGPVPAGSAPGPQGSMSNREKEKPRKTHRSYDTDNRPEVPASGADPTRMTRFRTVPGQPLVGRDFITPLRG